MEIGLKKVVSVNYVLTSFTDANNHETLVEETQANEPFVFLFGTGHLLEEFEQNLLGKKAGDAFDFIIKNGYGDSNDENIVELPLDAFKNQDGEIDHEMVTVGRTLPMQDSEGNRLQGTIVEMNDSMVVMDFNHPMAGKHLHFKGQVIDIREAQEDELAHGHVHGPHGHHH